MTDDELNKKIATLVFGWQHLGKNGWSLPDPSAPGHGIFATDDDIVNYCNCSLSAWSVVAAMEKKGYSWNARSLNCLIPGRKYRFEFEDFSDFTPAIAGGVGYVQGGEDEWHWPADEETLPRAICVAAVAALERAGGGVT